MIGTSYSGNKLKERFSLLPFQPIALHCPASVLTRPIPTNVPNYSCATKQIRQQLLTQAPVPSTPFRSQQNFLEELPAFAALHFLTHIQTHRNLTLPH